MPAAAVIQAGRVLFFVIGCKGCVDRMSVCKKKYCFIKAETFIRVLLEFIKDSRIFEVGGNPLISKGRP